MALTRLGIISTGRLKRLAPFRNASDDSLPRRRYKIRQNPWAELSRKTEGMVPEPLARLGIRSGRGFGGVLSWDVVAGVGTIAGVIGTCGAS